jgi:hypothetical protein
MQKGMQLAMIKELSEMAEVTKELSNRRYGNQFSHLEI